MRNCISNVFLNFHCVKYIRARVFSDPYFPYKNRIEDYVLKGENRAQRKPVFSHILRRACFMLPLPYKFGFYESSNSTRPSNIFIFTVIEGAAKKTRGSK